MKVNGVPTEALVDTGSSATIVSLDFAMKVFAKERDKFQSTAEWQDKITEKFSDPEVTLKNYGGHRLDIMAQVLVSLTQGEHQIEAMVLVQKGAPNNLLLGSDVQPQLGFSLAMEKSSTEAVDLLTSKTQTKETSELLLPSLGNQETELVSLEAVKAQPEPLITKTEADECVSPSGVVCLLQATRIPSGYKMVRAKVKMKHAMICCCSLPCQWMVIW